MSPSMRNGVEALSPGDVARALGLSKKTVLRMLRDGRIPGVKVGRRWMISRDQLRALIATGTPNPPRETPTPHVANGDRYYARASYERLLLLQPHVKTEGLYGRGHEFFIVCPDAETTIADNGQPIADWFHKSCKIVGSWVSIVKSPPEGTTRIGERSLEDLVDLVGEPLTSRDADLLMDQLLGRHFPFVSFGCEPGEKCVLTVTRALDAAETRQLEESYSSFSIDLPLHVEILESPAPSKPFRFAQGQGDLHLQTTRHLPPETPQILRQRMEEDEDFWGSARRLLWGPDADQIEAVPESFISDGGGCLVDTAIWTAGNIRSYLALHHPATFVLPLASNTTRLLESLRTTERDLLELTRIGRVRFVAPQAVDRYDPAFLAALCEAAPDAVLLSRRLAVATAVECKRRLPLLYPSAGTLERHAMLAMISELASLQRDKMQRDIFEALGSTLKRSWSQAEYRLQFEGAMSTSVVGFASFVAELIKRWHGKDLLIEAHAASMAVEWALALNMSLFPVESPGYSAVPMSESLAAAYLGTRQAPAAASLGASERILSGILAPLNDASVLDVCEVFDGRAVKRLRNIVHRVADQSLTTEILDDEVRKFNEEVRRYERRKSRQAWIDIAAPAGILAAQLQLGASAWIPWSIYFIGRVLTMQDARPSGWLGHLADRIESAKTVSTRDAVLVSRLRRDLS